MEDDLDENKPAPSSSFRLTLQKLTPSMANIIKIGLFFTTTFLFYYYGESLDPTNWLKGIVPKPSHPSNANPEDTEYDVSMEDQIRGNYKEYSEVGGHLGSD